MTVSVKIATPIALGADVFRVIMMAEVGAEAEAAEEVVAIETTGTLVVFRSSKILDSDLLYYH